VRQELGVKSNLVDSQVAWGGLSSLIREKGSDYADNHSYWQHPSFPGKAWDTSNWLIGNTPMVDAMVNHSDGLSDLARFRFAGKPYTISEYNHPAPSDYRVEMMPLLSTFAAMQDWDGFYLFEYGVFGTGQKNDQIGGFFDIGLDPVRAGFLNSAALIFRSGYVRPLASSNLVVVPPEVAELGGSNAWSGHPNDPLSQRLAISSEGVTGITIGAKVNPVGWLKNADGAIFTVQEPKALVAVGHVANQALKLQTPGGGLGLSFSFGQFGRGFASVTCTPTKNGTYLLTIASRAENQGINWNGARTTIGADWGHGPVLAEGVPCDLVVSGVPVKHAWALDPTGRKARPIEVKYENGHATLHLSPADETIWYELMP